MAQCKLVALTIDAPVAKSRSHEPSRPPFRACRGRRASRLQPGQNPSSTMANAVVNEPMVLPPSIVASKAYRCKDNSLVYVD